jgi:transcriptional regulator with XRE-family HTH domain
LSILKVSIKQIKAARELLGWSQERMAEASGVSIPTVKRLEATDGELGGRKETREKIRAALESAGVAFTNGDEPGVKLRKGSICDPSASIPVEDLNASNDE